MESKQEWAEGAQMKELSKWVGEKTYKPRK